MEPKGVVERCYEDRWRERAEELRAIAETMTQETPRQQLLDMAVEYDQMAKSAEDLGTTMRRVEGEGR